MSKGAFANVSGSSQCLSCPMGEFQSLPGSRDCIKCPHETKTLVDGLI
jgi:hypothetical protein